MDSTNICRVTRRPIRIGELIPAIIARVELAMRAERDGAGPPQREVRR